MAHSAIPADRRRAWAGRSGPFGGSLHLTGQASERVTEQESLLRVQGLKKVFRSGESDLVLFENLSFEVKRGEMLAIVGESGAGKSTLLHILSALDHASAGDVYCAQLKLNSLSADEASAFRNRDAGFVWQFHYLLPEFTAAELSGGEQQRVALARALITGPKLLLADEPTGDLDGQTAEAVFELIARLHREHQLTSLIATHNLSFARRCHRVLRLQRGLVEEIRPGSLPA